MIDFVNVPCGTAVDNAFAAQSGKNVLTVMNGTGMPLFDARWGAAETVFGQLQQSISVRAYAMDSPEGLGSSDNRPFMEAYNSDGAYLGKVRTRFGPKNANFFGHWHPLSFSSPTRNIQRIRLSSQAQGSPRVYTAFDNLTFDRNILLT